MGFNKNFIYVICMLLYKKCLSWKQGKLYCTALLHLLVNLAYDYRNNVIANYVAFVCPDYVSSPEPTSPFELSFVR